MASPISASSEPRSNASAVLVRGLLRSTLVLASVTAAAVLLRLNAAGAGLLLMVGVLLVASRQPLHIATISALAATVSYNYFFFHPKRTLTIADPENWIALATFLVTSLLANRLLVRERLQAKNAEASRQDVEALYDLSLSLLRDVRDVSQIGEAAVRYLHRIHAKSGGVILFGASPQHQRVLAWSEVAPTEEVEELVAGVGRHGRVACIPSRYGQDVCVPLAVSSGVGGALVFRGPRIATSALESAASLLAFAIEREIFVEERARIEATRETNELKTSLLHAVAHDLKSPLTVLGVESEALERRLGSGPSEEAVHVRAIRDEVSLLQRRIDNLLSLARLEAGMVTPRTEPTPAADVFRATRESLPTITAVRPIRTTVAENTPDLLVDPSIALEIVINLVENADRASPPATPIELCAIPSADTDGRVWLEVRDRGTGLPVEQSRRVHVLEHPDVPARGFGIELARTLAALSGGTVEWFARDGGGTIARLELPSAWSPEEVV